MTSMIEPSVAVRLDTAELRGECVSTSQRAIADLAGIFRDEAARGALPGETPVYRVQVWAPTPENTPGGLAWGSTFIQPGKVGDEYFMTRGHFHARRDRAEFYVTVQGEGGLILMDEQRKVRCEWMRPGSVHYIPGHTAHRAANTGSSVLAFLAAWNIDAGHDYETIARHGFAARLREVAGAPALICEP